MNREMVLCADCAQLLAEGYDVALLRVCRFDVKCGYCGKKCYPGSVCLITSRQEVKEKNNAESNDY